MKTSHFPRSLRNRLLGLIPMSLLKMVSRAQWQHPVLKRSFDWCADRLRNQDGRINHGAGQGLLFNPGTANAGFLLGTSEPAVQKVFQLLIRPGAVVYDIGSNVGFLTLIAARLSGPSGRVVAFEPVPENFELIKHNARLNGFDNVSAGNIALSNRDGIALFIKSKNPTWGKLADLDKAPAEQDGSIVVSVRTLDNFLLEVPLPLPHLMKIDVEGAEVKVLDGAWQTIRISRPILIIELHGTNAAVAQRLAALNYSPVVLESSKPVVDSHWNSHVIAFPEPCEQITQIQGITASQ